MLNKRFLPELSLILMTFIWGATFAIVQNAVEIIEPIFFNALRFFIASLFLAIFLLLLRKPNHPLIEARFLIIGGIIGFILFLGYAFQTLGLQYTTATKAGFITGLCVVIVPFLSFLLLRIKPSLSALTGAGLATVGLFLMTFNMNEVFNYGDFLVFLCSFCFALHIIAISKYCKQFDSLPLALVQIVTVSLLCLIYSFFFEDWRASLTAEILFNNDVIIALLLTAIPATAIAFLVQNEVQKVLSPTRTVLIFSLEPVFAAIVAFWLSGEIISTKAVIGGFFIVTGMIVADLPLKVTRIFLKEKK